MGEARACSTRNNHSIANHVYSGQRLYNPIAGRHSRNAVWRTHECWHFDRVPVWLTQSQRTRHTLQRTFTEFLAVLEDSIASELQYSLAFFTLFEAIDRQFLNLARTVVDETTAQENAQDGLLSSLWTKILGPDSSTLSKFERNKRLLAKIRAKTVQNKSILLEHNGKLLTLKANLESLRRKLVSPLLRANASTLGVEDQIRGLEEVGGHLSGVRDKQKGRLMEMLYVSGSHGSSGVIISDRGEIDARWE